MPRPTRLLLAIALLAAPAWLARGASTTTTTTIPADHPYAGFFDGMQSWLSSATPADTRELGTTLPGRGTFSAVARAKRPSATNGRAAGPLGVPTTIVLAKGRGHSDTGGPITIPLRLTPRGRAVLSANPALTIRLRARYHGRGAAVSDATSFERQP